MYLLILAEIKVKTAITGVAARVISVLTDSCRGKHFFIPPLFGVILFLKAGFAYFGLPKQSI
jgi:hypothetical protein